eukprot:3163119-Pleurochrysis_carterae.AAC.2
MALCHVSQGKPGKKSLSQGIKVPSRDRRTRLVHPRLKREETTRRIRTGTMQTSGNKGRCCDRGYRP